MNWRDNQVPEKPTHKKKVFLSNHFWKVDPQNSVPFEKVPNVNKLCRKKQFSSYESDQVMENHLHIFSKSYPLPCSTSGPNFGTVVVRAKPVLKSRIMNKLPPPRNEVISGGG